MYKLNLSKQQNLLVNSTKGKIAGVYPLNVDGTLIVIRQEGNLIGYEYDAVTESWNYRWHKNILNEEYTFSNYPWYVDDLLNDGKNQVIFRDSYGLSFYQLNVSKPGLDLITRDRRFHNNYRQQLLIGRFYPDQNLVGVISRNYNGVKFYVVMKDQLLSKSRYPLWDVDSNFNFSTNWQSETTDWYLEKLEKDARELIIIKTDSSVDFYKFNDSSKLERIFTATQIVKSDDDLNGLFFGNLTNQKFQDMLHFNNSGLYLYQYNDSVQNYVVINRNSKFSRADGWLPEYLQTVKLFDLNRDGRDDLLFTGKDGLSFLSFNFSNLRWENILNIDPTQRFSTVVGVLPSGISQKAEPIVFTQSSNSEQLRWAKITEVIEIKSTTAPTVDVPEDRLEPINISTRPDAIVPRQIKRVSVPQNFILPWNLKWNSDFLKNSVDSNSGAVRFSFPLISHDISSELKMEISLLYGSDTMSTTVLGEGWKLPLGHDYILVNYQGSIFPHDATYSINIEGRLINLKLVKAEYGVKYFELEEVDQDEWQTEIKYYEKKGYWVIENNKLRAVYGKSADSKVEDALQYILGWPNWRDRGSDKEHLQPLIAAWYLNTHFDKIHNKSLFYSYDIDKSWLDDNKVYNSDVRLVKITDSVDSAVIFKYDTKLTFEYDKHSPVNSKDEIHFPVAFTHAHYLSDCRISTATYTQNFKFTYGIKNNARLLTEISQELHGTSESIAQLKYVNVNDRFVLSSCQLFNDITAYYTYTNGEMVVIPIAHSKVKFDKEDPKMFFNVSEKDKFKIAYAFDYAVLAQGSKDLGDFGKQIRLEVTNIELTKKIADCTSGLFCAIAEHVIQDYELKLYSNSFFVYFKVNNKLRFILYTRDAEKNWNLHPHVYDFNINSLAHFSDCLVVVADPNKITVLESNKDKSSWGLKIISETVTSLALSGKYIFCNVGHHLVAHFLDSNNHWTRKVLKSNLGIDSLNALELFNFEEELISNYKQNSLQASKNLITLHQLIVENDVLKTNLHTFIIDAELNIVKEQTINLEEQNIFDPYDHKYNGTTFNLQYVKEVDKYKVRINKFSGNLYDEYDKNYPNDNKRDDEIAKQIEGLNKDGTFTKMVLVNFNPTMLTSQGIYFEKNKHEYVIKFTGENFLQPKLIDKFQSVILDKYFILELKIDQGELTYLLYKQNSATKQKAGFPVKVMKITTANKIFVNSYPYYMAYQDSSNSTVMFTFKDGKMIDKNYEFKDEELRPESTNRNLITIKNDTCLVRPITTLLSATQQTLIKSMKLDSEGVSREMGYQYIFHSNQEKMTYEKITQIIPADDRTISGWYQESFLYDVISRNVTRAKLVFDNYGREVQVPINDKSEEGNSEKTTNPYHLTDKSGQIVISDFTPYTLSSEMVSYYGFEIYESNRIGNSTQTWHVSNAQVVTDGFSLTGNSYLFVQGNWEVTLEPEDQSMTYLASCWLRLGNIPKLNSTITNFKVILSTKNDHEITGFYSTAKNQIENWTYAELIIDFQLMKRMYTLYLAKHPEFRIPVTNDSHFKLTFKIEAAADGLNIDVDHFRFFPLSHNFKATIYNAVHNTPIDIIQANGLASKVIYNHFNDEIATLDEYGHIEQLVSRNKIVGWPNTFIFKPTEGFLENFSSYSLSSRWEIDDALVWEIANYQIRHTSVKKHKIVAHPDIFKGTSFALRFYYVLQSQNTILSLNWNEIGNLRLISDVKKSFIILPDSTNIPNLPADGELIVSLNENHLLVVVNGVLKCDKVLSINDASSLWADFKIEAQGHLVIQDLFVMKSPYVQVDYHNMLGEKTQTVQLETRDSVIVTEIIYDKLGRAAITTKHTRIKRRNNEQILKYYADFVINKHPDDANSVWNRGTLEGLVTSLNPEDEGFSYFCTQYAKDPLNDKRTVALPGKLFSANGNFAKHFNRDSGIHFLSNLFPISSGFIQQVEMFPNGSKKVSIFDKQNNRVAIYSEVPSFDHVLATYEYDVQNRLIKVLPPLYHHRVGTLGTFSPLKFGEEHLTPEQKQLQSEFASYFHYDDDGNLIRKITPESGTTNYLYNSVGEKRFMVSANQTVYFEYDENGDLIETGYLTKPFTLDKLKTKLDSYSLPEQRSFQTFNNGGRHFNSLLRNSVKSFITNNDDGEIVVEEMKIDKRGQMISKAIFISKEINTDEISSFEREFVNDQIRSITYPIKYDGRKLHFTYKYNNLKQLISLEAPGSQLKFQFSYSPSGQLASEYYNVENFTRSYGYNSPGYLEYISDPFLTETVSYTENGYGQDGFGDGMIMQTLFNASWPHSADKRWFTLQDDSFSNLYDSKSCFLALKHTGYISATGESLKMYVEYAEIGLPRFCTYASATQLKKVLSRKQTPTYYGHRYAYGNHQELIRAKYFTRDNENEAQPLMPKSFSEKISSLTLKQSQEIWQFLVNGGFIVADERRYSFQTTTATKLKSIFPEMELRNQLKALNDEYGNDLMMVKFISKILLIYFGNQMPLPLAEFEKIILSWENINHNSLPHEKIVQQNKAIQIWSMLRDHNYISENYFVTASVLEKDFQKGFEAYSHILPTIVKVLLSYFANQLQSSPFDIESYAIDANGNHHHFYTGSESIELLYNSKNSNQIQNITMIDDKVRQFTISHDTNGNVITAFHKNIKNIQYHPVSQRTTKIELTNNQTIHFYYDALGERVLKKVFDSNGKLKSKMYYLRDEKGNVLLDQKTIYDIPLNLSQQKITTAYVYGARGLLGFIRDGQFYGVFTDHAGSVRLVMKDGHVVAAYDYLPYGELMRTFGNDPKAHIVYRYTGQEYDEETGLYNYHARLYDPTIGRFYQIDPMAQYFSPYKYAGNSPISLVDPNGELAILLIAIGAALVLGYIGGAAANNRFNPLQWDWKDKSTYFGVGGGLLAGAFLPFGVVGSVNFMSVHIGTMLAVTATLAMGVGGMYVSAAAANQNWDPSKWQWDSPATINALLQGFTLGASMPGSIGAIHNFANLGIQNVFLRKLFLGASYSLGGGIALVQGASANNGTFAFWNWDFSNPETISSLLNGFESGFGMIQGSTAIVKGIGVAFKDFKNLVSSQTKLKQLISTLKNKNSYLYKVTSSAIISYYMGASANNEFDISQWSANSFSTYEGVFNGLIFTQDVKDMYKMTKGVNKDPKINKPEKADKPQLNFRKKLSKFIDGMLVTLKNEMFDQMMKDAATRKEIVSEVDKNVPALKQEIDSFFQKNVEVGKQSLDKLSESSRDIISKQVEKCISDSSNKLLDLKEREESASKREGEIVPDREIDFLHCFSKRSKRADIPTSIENKVCDAGSSSAEKVPAKELTNLILDSNFKYSERKAVPVEPERANFKDGFDPNNPNGLEENLSLLLHEIPRDHAGNNPDFYLGMLLGSLETSKHETRYKVEQDYKNSHSVYVDIPQSGNTHKSKAFIIGNQNTPKSSAINPLKRPNNAIDTQFLNINTGEGNPLTVAVAESKERNYVDSESSVNYENLFNKLIELENSIVNYRDKDVVEETARSFFDELREIYVKKTVNMEQSEALFHGFIFGAISFNFKKSFDIDMTTERVSGKGYTDLTMIFQKKSPKWKAVEIIIEVKMSKSKDSSANKKLVDTAMKQIVTNGYSTTVTSKSISDDFVAVGISDKEVQVEVLKRPKPENVIEAISKFNKQKDDTVFGESLKNFYFSFSNMSNRGPISKWFSRSIYGQLIGNCAKVYVKYSNELRVTTYLYLSESDWTMVNIAESGMVRVKGQDLDFPVIDLQKIGVPHEISQQTILKVVNIKVNPHSREGWLKDPKTTPKLGDDFYYQGAVVAHESKLGIPTINEGYQLITPNVDPNNNPIRNLINVENLFPDFSQADLTTNLNTIKATLDVVTSYVSNQLIKHESDVQAVLHGYFLSHQETKIIVDGKVYTQLIKVAPELNCGRRGKADLAVWKILKNEKDDVIDERLHLMEIKRLGNTEDFTIQNKLDEAREQVQDYVDDHNMKSLTGNDFVILSAVVYTPNGVVVDVGVAPVSRPYPKAENMDTDEAEVKQLDETIWLERSSRMERRSVSFDDPKYNSRPKLENDEINSYAMSSASVKQFWPLAVLKMAVLKLSNYFFPNKNDTLNIVNGTNSRVNNSTSSFDNSTSSFDNNTASFDTRSFISETDTRVDDSLNSVQKIEGRHYERTTSDKKPNVDLCEMLNVNALLMLFDVLIRNCTGEKLPRWQMEAEPSEVDFILNAIDEKSHHLQRYKMPEKQMIKCQNIKTNFIQKVNNVIENIIRARNFTKKSIDQVRETSNVYFEGLSKQIDMMMETGDFYGIRNLAKNAEKFIIQLRRSVNLMSLTTAPNIMVANRIIAPTNKNADLAKETCDLFTPILNNVIFNQATKFCMENQFPTNKIGN